MAYKAAIFDFFEVVHGDPVKFWLEKHGLSREGAVTEACAGLDVGLLSLDEYSRHLGILSGQETEAVKDDLTTLGEVNNEVVDIIEALRHQMSLGLLTNTTGEVVWPLLGRHSLKLLFNEIVVSAEVGVAKPDRRIFWLMLERLGVQPAEAIFIDDNPVNVTAARNLGMGAIHFTNAESLRIELIAGHGLLSS